MPDLEIEKETGNTVSACTQPLGLTRSYAVNWNTRDALRELYQNWKDAIIQRHDLPFSDFSPEVKETNVEILITVKGSSPLATPAPFEYLGFIRFKKAAGTLEFTNFGSALNRQCLELGYSSKVVDDRLAGGHGEGLKIAALILCRNQHHVKISANGFYWNFRFGGKQGHNFYCRLHPASADKIVRLKAAYEARCAAGRQRQLAANIWEDVSVLIEKGHNNGCPLKIEELRDWMRTTIDIYPPTERIRTLNGDLILDPAYAGKLYLKGIQVPLVSAGKHDFCFGYNLMSGSLNRDRQQMMDIEEEARNVALIWEGAIRQQEERTVPLYTGLLRYQPLSADVKLAERETSKATAERIWTGLLSEAKTAGTFYYCEDRGDADSNAIRSELRSNPIALPNSLWRLLRRYGLVNIPGEELRRRFEGSQPVEIPKTRFACEADRAFRALLAAEQHTQQIRIVYVSSESETTNAAYLKERNTLYIHERWLDFNRAHNGSECAALCVSRASDEHFFCDHVVEELYKRIIALIWSPFEILANVPSQQAEPLHVLLQRCRERLREMPRMIQTHSIEGANNSLRVSWDDGHSRAFSRIYGSRVQYMVVLHATTCLENHTALVHMKDSACDCPRKLVPQGLANTVFDSLDDQVRFPMVASFKEGSLYGLPPPARSPAVRVHSKPAPLAFSVLGMPDCRDAIEQNSGDMEVCHKDVKWAKIADTLAQDHEETRPSGGSVRERSHTELSCNHWKHGSVDTDRPKHEQPSLAISSSVAKMSDGHSIIEEPSVEPLSKRTTEQYPITQCKEESSHRTLKSEQWAHNDLREGFNLLRAEKWTPLSQTGFQNCVEYREFKKGTYAEVSISTVPDTPRYVFYVHDILINKDDERATQLLVTRYSYLAAHPAFTACNTPISDKELLLHFVDFDLMGEYFDAETVNLEDILLYQQGPQAVDHVTEVRAQVSYFCRFAIQSGTDLNTACITPLSRPTAEPSGSRSMPNFSTSCVPNLIELSPGNVETSRALERAGFRIGGAAYFDEQRHRTWRDQYPNIPTCGPDEDIVKFAAQLEPSRPLVATISGGTCAPYSNPQEPAVDTGSDGLLESLRRCCSVANSSKLRPDFISLTMGCVNLDKSAFGPLMHTVLTLLAQKYSVVINLEHVTDDTLPQTQTILCILAVPFCTNPQWLNKAMSDLGDRMEPCGKSEIHVNNRDTGQEIYPDPMGESQSAISIYGLDGSSGNGQEADCQYQRERNKHDDSFDPQYMDESCRGFEALSASFTHRIGTTIFAVMRRISLEFDTGLSNGLSQTYQPTAEGKRLKLCSDE